MLHLVQPLKSAYILYTLVFAKEGQADMVLALESLVLDTVDSAVVTVVGVQLSTDLRALRGFIPSSPLPFRGPFMGCAPPY